MNNGTKRQWLIAGAVWIIVLGIVLYGMCYWGYQLGVRRGQKGETDPLVTVKKLDNYDYMTNVRHFESGDKDIYIEVRCDCGNRIVITQPWDEEYLVDGCLEYTCRKCGRVHRFRMADDGVLERVDTKTGDENESRN